MRDRRERSRFEVVGTLAGTLEVPRRLHVRNLGVGGALIESTVPIVAASRARVRVLYRGRPCEVRAEVRHVTWVRDEQKGVRYLAGLAWDSPILADDLMAMESADVSPRDAHQGPERRSHPRLADMPDVAVEWPTYVTVQITDISRRGVLLTTLALPPTGTTGWLRVRLGNAAFLAGVEVRRAEARRPPEIGNRIGAAFVAIDETSRRALDEFLKRTRN
jgi:hypothetical protein